MLEYTTSSLKFYFIVCMISRQIVIEICRRTHTAPGRHFIFLVNFPWILKKCKNLWKILQNFLLLQIFAQNFEVNVFFGAILLQFSNNFRRHGKIRMLIDAPGTFPNVDLEEKKENFEILKKMKFNFTFPSSSNKFTIFSWSWVAGRTRIKWYL